MASYRYRPDVLDALRQHGVEPGPHTPPSLVRSFLNDLYRYELRRLRRGLLDGLTAKPDYAEHVIRLRARYPLLSLPERFWTIR